VEGLLAAMGAVGLDAAAIAAAAGLPEPLNVEVDYSRETLAALFLAAGERRPVPELPTEIGLAAPFGCFGIIDYLAGSAATVEGGLRALASHFAGITREQRLSIVEGPSVSLEVRTAPDPLAPFGEEFTLAVTAGRFRRLTGDRCAPLRVTLRRASPGPTRHSELLGCPVAFDAPTSALLFTRESARMPLATADARLAASLADVARRLDLAAGDEPELVAAVRGRLRDSLPRGDLSAASVARTLGVSERTLHRRLSSSRTTFQSVLDAFRARESERLLRAGVPLVEIALALGYGDQTAWTRAFRRWNGTSPTAWLQRERGPSGPPR
jgi:AraC-like DNA-binding protein